MSIRAMNWAWVQNLAPTPKLILMALADSANDHDECWPGIPFIANKCSVSGRTVQRNIQKFEAAGLISVSPRYTSAGRQTSNGYRLCVAGSSPDKLPPSAAKTKVGVDNLKGTGVTPVVTGVDDSMGSPLETSHDPEQQPLHFPPQLSSADRSTIAGLVLGLEHSEAQALLDELADAIETASIKTNPQRWMRGLIARQKVGAFVPAGGVRIGERRTSRMRQQNAQQQLRDGPTTDKKTARAELLRIKQLVRVPSGIKPDERLEDTEPSEEA